MAVVSLLLKFNWTHIVLVYNDKKQLLASTLHAVRATTAAAAETKRPHVLMLT
jgi:hypothetical protein